MLADIGTAKFQKHNGPASLWLRSLLTSFSEEATEAERPILERAIGVLDAANLKGCLARSALLLAGALAAAGIRRTLEGLSSFLLLLEINHTIAVHKIAVFKTTALRGGPARSLRPFRVAGRKGRD